MTARKKPTPPKAKAATKPSRAVRRPGVVIGKPATASSGVAAFGALVARAAGRKMVLHIGCGSPNPAKLHKTYQSDDWHEIRLDIDASAAPDIVADMLDMSMIPDNAVDAVWSSHNIEHLYPHTVPAALKEIFRVIKPEGHFLVTLPDIQTVATYVAHGGLEDPIYDSPAGPICPIDIMYGLRSAMARGNLFMAHRTAFTAKTLADHLGHVGFSSVRVTRDWVDLWGLGYKYPVGHPKRVERVMIEDHSQNPDKPVKMPAPLPINRAPHPGFFSPKLLTDELDIPPKLWEPVKL